MLSMAACFPTYGAAAVQERGKELWEGIKTEVSRGIPPEQGMTNVADPVQLGRRCRVRRSEGVRVFDEDAVSKYR